MSVITVRAADHTPLELRHLDGRTYRLPTDFPYQPGFTGALFGIPGTLIEDDGVLVWEVSSATPPPRVASAQLGDLLQVLIEIRDLLREVPWSALAVASTDSSTGHGTAPTEP